MRLTLPLLVLLFFQYQSQNLNYYFGNIHSHTGFSDGNQDSLASGVSTPAGSYAYAKLSQNFHFLGISEHNHYSNNNNPGFQIQNWQPGLDMANNANQDGTFLCLFGMEWGVSSNYNGHVLIYGYNQLIGWEPGNYQVYNGKFDYDALFRKIKNTPGAFITLAHPAFTDFTTAGTGSTSLLYGPYNSAYDSAIVGTPLRSGLYNTTTSNYTAYPSGNYFDYYQKILSHGYHLGCTYDHDNHNTTFGRSNAGRLVVIMPSLTRTNFFTAMRNMNFYGSDDWNAKVSLTMNGNIMGSILSGTASPVFNVVHNDPDGETADSIKIWRGISGSNVLPIVVSSNKQNNTLVYADGGMQTGAEYYYFAEIKQTDGQWIVTSPIWYKNTSPTAGLNEQQTHLEINFFPNPVSQLLSISTAECDDYAISILDISGRTVYSETVFEKTFKINLSAIAPGVYTLKVEGSKGSTVKRLIVE